MSFSTFSHFVNLDQLTLSYNTTNTLLANNNHSPLNMIKPFQTTFFHLFITRGPSLSLRKISHFKSYIFVYYLFIKTFSFYHAHFFFWIWCFLTFIKINRIVGLIVHSYKFHLIIFYNHTILLIHFSFSSILLLSYGSQLLKSLHLNELLIQDIEKFCSLVSLMIHICTML